MNAFVVRAYFVTSPPEESTSRPRLWAVAVGVKKECLDVFGAAPRRFLTAPASLRVPRGTTCVRLPGSARRPRRRPGGGQRWRARPVENRVALRGRGRAAAVTTARERRSAPRDSRAGGWRGAEERAAQFGRGAFSLRRVCSGVGVVLGGQRLLACRLWLRCPPEKIELPESCGPRKVTPSDPRELRGCPKIAEQLPRLAGFGADVYQTRPVWPKCRSKLAKIGRVWSTSANKCPNPANILANFGRNPASTGRGTS